MVLPPLQIPAIKLLNSGLAAAAKKNNVRLLVCAEGSAEGQNNCGNTYIARKVDLLGVNALDGVAFAAVVKKANAAGIPVASMIAPPKGATKFHVGADYFQLGVLQGKAMVNYCRSHNPCKVGVIQGDAADLASNAVRNGIVRPLKATPSIDIVTDAQSKWDDAEILRITADTLTRTSDLVAMDVMYEAGAVIALQAVKAAGKSGQVKLFTAQAYFCPAHQALLKGSIAFDAFSPWRDTGVTFMNTAAKLLKGKKVVKRITLPAFGVTTAQAKAIVAGKQKAPAYVTQMLKQAQAGC